MSEKSYAEPLQKFVDKVLGMAEDAEKCLSDGVKTAGRKARKSLSGIANDCKELRKTILAKMKE
jgi:hypothetical protein